MDVHTFSVVARCPKEGSFGVASLDAYQAFCQRTRSLFHVKH